MPILEADDRPFAEVDHVGVVIQIPTPGYWHAGWLYRLPEEEPRVLHLEGHYRLSDQIAAAPFRWAQVGIDSLNKEILAVLISRIANKHPSIPYAFDCDGVLFDEETGDLAHPSPGKGLTCATLIVAVLATFGHQLLNAETWPQMAKDDEDFVQLITDHMEDQGATAEHIEAIRVTETARLRPTQVVGASNLDSSEWPVAFPTAEELAAQVMADLA